MKYFIGKDRDSNNLIVGHELVYFGDCVRIMVKCKDGSEQFFTVDPSSLHIIEGEVQRVKCIRTDGGLVFTSPNNL